MSKILHLIIEVQLDNDVDSDMSFSLAHFPFENVYDSDTEEWEEVGDDDVEDVVRKVDSLLRHRLDEAKS